MDRISSQGDAHTALKLKRDTLLAQNVERQKTLDRCLADRGRVIKVFRQQSADISNDVQDAEAATNAKLRAAIAEKHAEFQAQDNAIADIEKSIRTMKEELADALSEGTFLAAYRDKEQLELAKQIEALKSAIVDENHSFVDEKEDVQLRFERSKQMTSTQADQQMQDTRRRASEFALRRQSIKDKVIKFHL